jgi:hypothetical protein
MTPHQTSTRRGHHGNLSVKATYVYGHSYDPKFYAVTQKPMLTFVARADLHKITAVFCLLKFSLVQ